jgi:hypothetical protein
LGDATFSANPLNRLALTTTRSWNDSNGDFVPDCDLANPADNGECGPYANQNFGQNVFSASTIDPQISGGWGTRPYNWNMGITLQQQLLSRLSMTVDYNRRWYGNFITTENRAVSAADFDQFSIVAPSDPSLPNGGGQTITGLYDVKPAKFGLVDNFVTSSDQFGKQVENWQGVDVTLNARLAGGFTAQGGMSTGRLLTDTCEIRAARPRDRPLDPYCRVERPYLLQFKGLATYTVPRIDVQVSGTGRARQGRHRVFR